MEETVCVGRGFVSQVFSFPEFLATLIEVLSHVFGFCGPANVWPFFLLNLGAFIKDVGLTTSQARWPPDASFLKWSWDHLVACRLSYAYSMWLSYLLLLWGSGNNSLDSMHKCLCIGGSSCVLNVCTLSRYIYCVIIRGIWKGDGLKMKFLHNNSINVFCLMHLTSFSAC